MTADDDDDRRTRGGWVPSGTAAQRRANHARHGTARGKRTRDGLVAAARRVFERVGYFDATVDDIISEAGVARGSFYTYFPDKLSVFQVLSKEVNQTVLDAVATPLDAPAGDRIARLDAAHRRYIAVYRSQAKMYGLLEQVATIDPIVHERRLRSREAHVSRVAATIARWQAKGVADPTIDAHTVAALLVAMTSNICYWWIVGGEPHDEEQLTKELTDAWVRATGLRSRPKPAWLDAAR